MMDVQEQHGMTIQRESLLQSVLDVLAQELALAPQRVAEFTPQTPLLGALPELDSMAVIGLIQALERRFECHFDDDEIDGRVFATVASLLEMVQTHLRSMRPISG